MKRTTALSFLWFLVTVQIVFFSWVFSFNFNMTLPFLKQYRYDETIINEMCGGVDFVISWVNGSDANRMASIVKYWNQTFGPSLPIPLNRWREYGSLYYSVLTIIKHAPWARKIYIVTSDYQVPSFLDDAKFASFDFSKVVLVNDDQMWQDPSSLPSFNSHAFELNLPRIPGLSECFIYLCDDFYLGRPSQITEFFEISSDGNLVPIIFLEAHPPVADLENRLQDIASYENGSIKELPWTTDISSCMQSWFLLRERNILLRNRIITLPIHGGRPMIKSQVTRLLSLFPGKVEATTKSKFRSQMDVQLFCLYYWWNEVEIRLYSQNDKPRIYAFITMGLSAPTPNSFIHQANETFLSSKYFWIGINDDCPCEQHPQEARAFFNTFNVLMSSLLCQRVTSTGLDVSEIEGFEKQNKSYVDIYNTNCI